MNYFTVENAVHINKSDPALALVLCRTNQLANQKLIQDFAEIVFTQKLYLANPAAFSTAALFPE
jgi:hypothetical protein